jgi:cyclopropane fatty-acyl-phospholipid synthase-like methyltransferase
MLGYNFDTSSILDLGCAGGQLVVDCFLQGMTAIGLEGSDYNLKRQDNSNSKLNWEKYHNSVLFTCDISRSFIVTDDKNNPVKFDFITAWEVVEHIHPSRLDTFFENVKKHLKENGLFICTVSLVSDFSSGTELHQSLLKDNEWVAIIGKHFSFRDADNLNPTLMVRVEKDSLIFALEHKVENDDRIGKFIRIVEEDNNEM